MFKTLYLNRGTAVHRLDPRTKILALTILSVMLFIFNHPLYVGTIALGLVALGGLARSLENYVRARYLLLVLLLFPIVTWQFYLRGPTVTGPIWSLTVTRESLLYGLAAGIRYSSALMLGTLFASTITVEEVMLGLIRLRVPYSIAFIVSLAMRLVPTFVSVLTTIVEAQVGRGLDLETRNPFRRARNLVPVMVPFFIYTIRYSTVLSSALETRGFSLVAKRTYLRDLSMRAIDHMVLVGLLGAMTVCLLLRFRGYGAVIPGRI